MNKSAQYDMVLSFAAKIFDDADTAKEWMRTRQSALGGKIPNDLLETEPGATEVWNFLRSIRFEVTKHENGQPARGNASPESMSSGINKLCCETKAKVLSCEVIETVDGDCLQVNLRCGCCGVSVQQLIRSKLLRKFCSAPACVSARSRRGAAPVQKTQHTCLTCGEPFFEYERIVRAWKTLKCDNCKRKAEDERDASIEKIYGLRTNEKMSFAEIARTFGLTYGCVRERYKRGKRRHMRQMNGVPVTDVPEPVTEQSDIRCLDVSVRASNCLLNLGVRTIEGLTQLSREDLLKVKNMGRSAVGEIEEALVALGFSLKTR